MAKDKQLELFDSVESLKEELLGDNELSKEEREFQAVIKEALEQGRIPIECIELIPISDEMAMKTIVAKEC